MAKIIDKKHYTSVDLTGYTDNVFTAALNVILNHKRANGVAAQLALDLKALKDTKVVTTIVPGYSIVLVGTNTTAKGRAANRRVVATLKAK
ncbi:MAG TPA: hypothetical protein VMU68_10300 [Acidimicrobiales bacterium]|nr:hypothetical protein [Acidimicrobiales bacterium]